MIKNVSITKDRDELNVRDGDGNLLLNLRIAKSSRHCRADLSVKTERPELELIRENIQR